MEPRIVGSFTNPILDHFHHPRNVGIVEGHNRSYFEQENPWLIRILFTLRVNGDRIEEVRFKTQSCVTTTACSSALTEMVQGRTVEEALAVTPEQLSEYLGTVPSEKMYCCRLAIATLRKALQSAAPTSPGAPAPEGGAP